MSTQNTELTLKLLEEIERLKQRLDETEKVIDILLSTLHIMCDTDSSIIEKLKIRGFV